MAASNTASSAAAPNSPVPTVHVRIRGAKTAGEASHAVAWQVREQLRQGEERRLHHPPGVPVRVGMVSVRRLATNPAAIVSDDSDDSLGDRQVVDRFTIGVQQTPVEGGFHDADHRRAVGGFVADEQSTDRRRFCRARLPVSERRVYDRDSLRLSAVPFGEAAAFHESSRPATRKKFQRREVHVGTSNLNGRRSSPSTRGPGIAALSPIGEFVPCATSRTPGS